MKIILVFQIHTADVERGFSQMNLIMTDKRNCLTTASLRSLLSIKRSKTDYKAYDPSGAVIRWAPMSALRRRRTNSQPYGPRKKQAKEQYQDVPVSEADNENMCTSVEVGESMSVEEEDSVTKMKGEFI